MKTVFLFPGQGSQRPEMLDSFSTADAIAADVFSDVKEILGEEARDLDSEQRLQSTVYTQLCLLIASVISARELQAKGVRPDFVAGHSVGAFSAAVVSGVLSFKQALSLVHTRGQLMEQAYPQGYGMAALTGISESALQNILVAFNRDHGTVYLSNVNAADQQVVAGRLSDLQQLITQLETGGIRKAQLLHVAVPSHCPLMSGVSGQLEQALGQLRLQEPAIPYASNHTGRVLRTSDAIRTDLARSVATTLRWNDATSLIYELGGRIFIEMEPSGVLAKLAASTFPEAKVLSLTSGETDTTAWLWKTYQQQ